MLVSNVLPVKAVTSGIMESTEVNVANQTVSAESENSTDISSQAVINDDKESFLTEQMTDESVENARALAACGKGNFYIQDGLLYHCDSDKGLGQKVNQLCLPKSKIKDRCQLAHRFYHQGIKRTKEEIRSHFFWEHIHKTIQQYVDGCLECQLKACPLVKDRVPISVISRDHEPLHGYFQTSW